MWKNAESLSVDFEVAGRTPAGVNWDLPTNLLLGSSMVEHSAVNRRVVGSSPTRGAKLFKHLRALGSPKIP